jgi:hypothetical protein
LKLTRTTPAVLLGAAVLLASGCAPVPPERAALEDAIMRAVEPCEQQYPRFRVTGLNHEGRVFFEYPAGSRLSDREEFSRCVNEATKRARRKPPA